jgi:anti-sigma factor RsiW
MCIGEPYQADAMNCKDFLNSYSDYDDSLLEPFEMEQFRAHMAGCDSCARYDRVLRKGRMLARQLPPVTPGEDFLPRLNHRMHGLRRRPRRTAPLPALGGAATALAAVTVVLTSVWVVTLLDQGTPAASVAEAADEAFETTVGWSSWSGAVVVAGGGTGATPAAHRGWAAQRVDQPVTGAYSPLVTGPPAYRLSGAFPQNVGTTLHTLD